MKRTPEQLEFQLELLTTKKKQFCITVRQMKKFDELDAEELRDAEFYKDELHEQIRSVRLRIKKASKLVW